MREPKSASFNLRTTAHGRKRRRLAISRREFRSIPAESSTAQA